MPTRSANPAYPEPTRLEADEAASAVSVGWDGFLAQGYTLSILLPTTSTHPSPFTPAQHESCMREIRQLRENFAEVNPHAKEETHAYDQSEAQRTDAACYHLMVVDAHGNTAAALRFRIFPAGTTASSLRLFHYVRQLSPPAVSIQFSMGITNAANKALERGLRPAEISGLACASGFDHQAWMPVMVSACLAWMQLTRPALAFAYSPDQLETHASLTSLGTPVTYDGTPLSCAFDPQHGTTMQVVSYDSASASPVLKPLVQTLEKHFFHEPKYKLSEFPRKDSSRIQVPVMPKRTDHSQS